MNTFLISTLLGLFIVESETPERAWLDFFTTQDIDVHNSFITREELLKRGYQTITKTRHENVYLLSK